jgi:hypothetical protein
MNGGKNMVKEEDMSPKNSFKGYNFFTWLKKNKDGIKWGICVAVFLYIFLKFLLSPELVSPEEAVAVSLAVALAVKKALDVLDFFKSEVKLENGNSNK